MTNRESVRYGIYAAVIAIILALTGVFSSFDDVAVINNVLMLSTVILLLLVFATGYLAARIADAQSGLIALIINGALGGLIVGVALAILTLLNGSIDMSFVFPNVSDLSATTLMLGQEDITAGILSLLVFSAVVGGLAGLSFALPIKLRRLIFVSVALTCVIGLLQNQLVNIIALPDSLALMLVFLLAYLVGSRVHGDLLLRVGLGVAVGVVGGIVIALLTGQPDFLAGVGSAPRVLNNNLIGLLVIFGVVGLAGMLSVGAARSMHDGMLFFLTGLLVLGILNAQDRMNLVTALVILAIIFAASTLIPLLGKRADYHFDSYTLTEKRTTQRLIMIFALIVMLIAPVFLGQYITSVFDLVGLYIIMGIGLNVMVGYAGLLDLGFVASFAIGAYAMGLMTTPSLLTCGGVAPSDINADNVNTVCTGIMTFWQAWPLAALTAGLTGAMLGVPVLRLRGDYLAIVTLGFGEIINRLLLSSEFSDLLGGAQGISPIPQPVIDVTLPIVGHINIGFGNANNVYYLILFSTLLVAAVVYRLASTRLGRAWRSIRADEDVAEAMGIHLVRNKLLAFGISSTLAGVGGAIFGAWLQGIFPNSFTLLVSINVLSLIIIGGLGSIPGVVVGSLMLIGLPEVLRELQDYRLLAFGVLLVITMLLRPEGLVPPPVRRLSQKVEAEREESASGDQQTSPEVSYG
ncbi:MAG: hypothetical protein K8L99_21275 [Anaerolineae bacterium]|nr:hypothetical protein [Anaerolineae bacterium]